MKKKQASSFELILSAFKLFFRSCLNSIFMCQLFMQFLCFADFIYFYIYHSVSLPLGIMKNDDDLMK